jgi:ribosomal protein L40E
VENASTDSRELPANRSQPASLWQLYALLGMVAAAAAVWASRHTHPVALILISAATLSAAFVALMLHRAVAAFLGRGGDIAPLDPRQRDILEHEKRLVLRSIKELEFDHAMKKIGDEDFADLSGRLRARAMALMQDLERTPAPVAPKPVARPDVCPQCETRNDPDAKFCKSCGKALHV